jgi:hypothetical protein
MRIFPAHIASFVAAHVAMHSNSMWTELPYPVFCENHENTPFPKKKKYN